MKLKQEFVTSFPVHRTLTNIMGHISSYGFTKGSEMQYKDMILVSTFPHIEDLILNCSLVKEFLCLALIA